MKASALLSIDEVAERLTEGLRQLGWNVGVETDYPRDFKNLWAHNQEGILDAFTVMDIILMSQADDPNNVDVIFYFYADPGITGKGKGKRPYGKRAREAGARAFREFCSQVFQKACLDLEFLAWSCETSPYSPRINFKRDSETYERPAYLVSLYYWKRPLEESTGEYLALDDRKALVQELKETLQARGFRTQWRNPITKTENRASRFYIKQDLFKGLFSDLLRYHSPLVEIKVDFDGLIVTFQCRIESPKEPASSDKIGEMLRERLRPLLEEYPGLKYHLHEFLGNTEFMLFGRFPPLSKDKVIDLLEGIRALYAP